MKANKTPSQPTGLKTTRTILIGCCVVLALIWVAMAVRTFNPKPDLNGDNYCYYTYATSLATGQGYSDLTRPGNPPTANFPPGYPLLMTPLRLVTDSIVAQKWLNEFFVLGGILLLFFTLIRLGMRWDVSLVAAAAGLFSPRLWHFSTMMMSEASFFLTAAFVFYALARLYAPTDQPSANKRWTDDLRSPWLWAMIVVLLLNYHIRTQGLALVAGVGLMLLLRKRWAALAATVVGFGVGCLPYMLRNKALGLDGNRYLDTIMLSNPFQPDAGTLTLGEVVGRFFSTLKMLVFNAIPNTIFPYVDVNCDQPTFSFGLYLLGAVLLAVVVLGFWSMGSLRWGMIGYLAGTLGLISIFSTPSGNRYITSILPFLAAGLMCGICYIVRLVAGARAKSKGTKAVLNPRYPIALLLCLLFIPSASGITDEAKQSHQRYPMQYNHFLQVAKHLKKTAPEGTVVCSRKPQMFWMESGLPGLNYLYTKDTREQLAYLVEKEVDYVVLDALGYSSTYLYLLPCVQQFPQFFPVVEHIETSHTYLLRFEREQVAQFLKNIPIDDVQETVH